MPISCQIMLIYYLTFFIVVFSARLAKISKSAFVSFFHLSVGFLTMVFVAGLRNITVGSDSVSYARNFERIRSFQDVLNISEQTWEFGYWVLNWLVHFISDQYWVLFLVIALIVVSCYQWSILHYSESIWISFFVFFSMGFYTFFFNGARQGLACAVYALAVGSLLERNFKKYLIIVLIASLFHKTALVTIPVYFIFNKHNNLKTNIFIVLIGCVGAAFLQLIVSIGSKIDERYSTYATSGNGGGYIIVSFICVLCLFFIFFKKYVHIYREEYCLFLNMLIFGAIVSLVPTFFGLDPSGLLRLNLYFNISAVFLWPIVFKNLKSHSIRLFLTYTFLALYIILFTLTTERFGGLTPYMFNPSVPFI